VNLGALVERPRVVVFQLFVVPGELDEAEELENVEQQRIARIEVVHDEQVHDALRRRRQIGRVDAVRHPLQRGDDTIEARDKRLDGRRERCGLDGDGGGVLGVDGRGERLDRVRHVMRRGVDLSDGGDERLRQNRLRQPDPDATEEANDRVGLVEDVSDRLERVRELDQQEFQRPWFARH
jgi:hypothetical protein